MNLRRWQEFVPPHKLLTSKPGHLSITGVLNDVPNNPLSATISNVLEFFCALFKSNKAYNTDNVTRSMLSETLPPIEGQPVGQHYLVLKLIKGVDNSKPPKQKYSSTWSLDLVNYHLDT